MHFLYALDSDRRPTEYRQDRAKHRETGGENKGRAGGGADNPGPKRAGTCSGNVAVEAVGITHGRGATQPVEMATSVAENTRRCYY